MTGLHLTRRHALRFALASLAGPPLVGLTPFAGQAEEQGDSYPTDSGAITVVPIREASFVLKVPGMVIYNDPAGGAALFKGQPVPDLVLICHEHVDHFDLATLREVVGPATRLVVNPATMKMLPPEFRARTTALANGETVTVGAVRIEAIPAYHTVPPSPPITRAAATMAMCSPSTAAASISRATPTPRPNCGR